MCCLCMHLLEWCVPFKDFSRRVPIKFCIATICFFCFCFFFVFFRRNHCTVSRVFFSQHLIISEFVHTKGLRKKYFWHRRKKHFWIHCKHLTFWAFNGISFSRAIGKLSAFINRLLLFLLLLLFLPLPPLKVALSVLLHITNGMSSFTYSINFSITD